MDAPPRHPRGAGDVPDRHGAAARCGPRTRRRRLVLRSALIWGLPFRGGRAFAISDGRASSVRSRVLDDSLTLNKRENDRRQRAHFDVKFGSRGDWGLLIPNTSVNPIKKNDRE